MCTSYYTVVVTELLTNFDLCSITVSSQSGILKVLKAMSTENHQQVQKAPQALLTFRQLPLHCFP